MTLTDWLNRHPEVSRTDTGPNWVELRGTQHLTPDARQDLKTLQDFAVRAWGLTHYQLVRYTRLV